LVRGRGIAIVTIATVVSLTAALSGCGQSQPARSRVALLPYTAGKGNTWDWTAACRFGPRNPTGCDPSGPDLGPSQFAGNEWNLGRARAATGSVKMSVDRAGALLVKGDLSTAPPCADATCLTSEANTWVRGYPSVLYGIDQCNAKTSPPQSSELQLPMQVRSVPSNLVGSTTYDAQSSEVTYDIAYDLWLNPSDTKVPCKRDGTLEVMVWTDYNAQSLLPASMKVGTASIPFAVDGAADAGTRAWSVYVNNVYAKGRTVPWGGTVWLVLDAAHAVKQGAVRVDLSTALAAVGGLLQNNYQWSAFADSYWLDTIAFGMEFGPQNGDPYGAGPTQFSLNLTSYCLEVRTTVAAAAC
jgi:hypothetical protein